MLLCVLSEIVNAVYRCASALFFIKIYSIIINARVHVHYILRLVPLYEQRNGAPISLSASPTLK